MLSRLELLSYQLGPDALRRVDLTLPGTGSSARSATLSEQLRILKIGSRTLRIAYASSGFGAVEATYNCSTGQWHTHLHEVWVWPKKMNLEMLRAFTESAGLGPRVRVSRLRGSPAYLAKIQYLAKGPEGLLPPEAMREYDLTMKGRRRWYSWGDAWGFGNPLKRKRGKS